MANEVNNTFPTTVPVVIAPDGTEVEKAPKYIVVVAPWISDARKPPLYKKGDVVAIGKLGAPAGQAAKDFAMELIVIGCAAPATKEEVEKQQAADDKDEADTKTAAEKEAAAAKVAKTEEAPKAPLSVAPKTDEKP